jgi:hypothetical protein
VVNEKIVVHPPMIFGSLLDVLPSPTAPGARWTATVADRRGATVTDDLDVERLQTYERFQAALPLKTWHPFL